MPRRRRHGLGPPAVRAVDVDGVRTVAVGTVLWAITFVVLALFRDDLDAAGVGWWMWTCLGGVGLGLLGLEYTRKRRDAIASARLREEADREDEPVLAEPEGGPVESEPVRVEPVPVRAEPEPVPRELTPVRVEEPDRMAPEPESMHAEPKPVRAEPEPVRAEPEPVVPKPVRPAASGPAPRADAGGEPWDVTTSEWAPADLLDVEPPVPGAGSPSRRARRAARTDEPFDDPDEPLLPIREDRRRVGAGPTDSREIRDDASDEDVMDEGEAGYRGRRARRP
jgi:Protein of unknown function (DUF2530)